MKTNRMMARQKAKSVRRIRDVNHKVSRQVVDWGVETGQTRMILSQPTGIAKAKGRKSQKQRNGYWEYGEQSRMIEYKAEGSIEIERDEERGTSSTCPKCNHRYHPSGRTFLCPNCGWSGHRDLVGSGNQLGRHEPHADVAALIEQAHPKYLRPWQQGRSSVDETDRPTGRPPTRLEEVMHYKAVGSGSPGTTAGGQLWETEAERLLLNRLWCEKNSWNKASPEHVPPITPGLQP
jgi:predicted RNA-binding Zn-ribbon protein involved in translation (DUF1610 family)